MSETTPHLALPLIAANQAQKHVPVNDALTKLDAVVQLSVISRDLAEPPPDPGEGDRYIVADEAAGDWLGQEGMIATRDSGWVFTQPAEGWRAWDTGAQELVVFTGGGWVAVTAGAVGESGFQNIPLLGVGVEADELNPFSAKLNGALWTACASGEGGTGDLRYVMNKEAGANVLSVLMQSDYSGRAEIGLIGDEDLLFKVSADGSVWKEALRVDKSSGRVSFPSGGVREVLTADRTYFVRTDGSDDNDGLEDTSGRAFASLQKAFDTVCTLDLGGHTAVVSVADGTYAMSALLINKPWVGGNIVFTGSGSAVLEKAGSGTLIVVSVLSGYLTFSGFRYKGGASSRNIFNLSAPGNVELNGAPVFDGPGGYCCAISHPAAQLLVRSCTISGNWVQAFYGTYAGLINLNGQTITLAGAPVFSAAFAYADRNSHITAIGTAYSGSATGKRFISNGGSVISAAGGTMPGDAAGEQTNGGIYY